ncbi:DUF3734 domain-containing protein [Paraburkholderia diazotrophica]|uniref:DUF3734 domain-containing protein n=1 Tax=Paraburkholderia diazotrophica TaxID=667676 RepID=UPI000B12B3CD|nr:DUF3734 domain-containing protein [Paraburkholderia diazotrophica]
MLAPALVDRVRNDLRFEQYANDFSDLVLDLMHEVDPETARRLSQRPNYIRLMGNRAPIHVTRISLQDEPPFATDFDFFAATQSKRCSNVACRPPRMR